MTEIIQKIDSIVTWYNTNESNISGLLENYKKLSGYLWYFAKFVSENKKSYNENYFVRKLSVARSKQELINKGLAVNKAENEALIENKEQYQASLDSEALAYKCDLLLRQGNRILDCMRTDLSYQKTEMGNL